MTIPAGHRAVPPDTYQRILDSIAPNAGRLKESYNGHLARALAVAVGVHLLGIGAYWLVSPSADPVVVTDGSGVIDVTRYRLPEPPIGQPPTPQGPGRPPVSDPRAGIVTPTPDESADPDATAPTQDDLARSEDGPAGDTPSGGTAGGEDGTAQGPPVGPGTGVTETPEDPEPVETPEPRVEPGDVLSFSEVPPGLIGGIEGLQSKIEYPSFDRSARNEGRVIVAFVVDENGVPGQIAVVRTVTPGLDAAAVAAVREARFTPGRQNGRAVKVRFTLPVTFRLR